MSRSPSASRPQISTAVRFALALAVSGSAFAQTLPGPLQPPPVPPQNPLTPNKILLGKTIFWDEQLSSTGTVACGTCHIPTAGGGDPRSLPTNAASVDPGPDHVFGTADDVTGSTGVVRNDATTEYERDSIFGLNARVTPRKTPPFVNQGYPPQLFWDGRAGGAFADPLTGQVVIPTGGALETLALAPPLSDVEMGHLGRTWPDVVQHLAESRPLALSPALTPDLVPFVAGRTYPELFQLAFGTPEVTPVRVAMALASYQRTLFTNQAPIDAFFAGDGSALTPLENQGRQVFMSPQTNCNTCHLGSRFTDDLFIYIGVRPAAEEPGRFVVTNIADDLGRMRVQSLRNVELRSTFFHNGRFTTLEQVVDFYDRGGDFTAPNKSPLIRPLNLTAQQKTALVAFLRRPLTDPRLANGLPPFDHPELSFGTSRTPTLFGQGTAGTAGIVPRVIAIEPSILGNTSFTVGLDRARPNSAGLLVIDRHANLFGMPFHGATTFLAMSPSPLIVFTGMTQGSGVGGGWDSESVKLPSDPSLIGTSLYGQWFVFDGGGGGRLAATEAFHLVLF